MKPLLLTDLDDTLFQTARKMADDAPQILAATSMEGKPLSFMHPWQHAFIHWALEHMIVLPVTARGIDSFQRVAIPFAHGAICLHGGAILTPSGTLDTAWHEHMHSALEPYQTRLPALLAKLLEWGQGLGLSLRGWLEQVDTLAVYLVIKSNASRADDLQQLLASAQTQLDLSGFYVHQNGNNLALLPDAVNKRAAAAAWLERYSAQHGRTVWLGMGDSLSDLGFMRLCDFAAFPPASQLAQQAFERTLATVPHL